MGFQDIPQYKGGTGRTIHRHSRLGELVALPDRLESYWDRTLYGTCRHYCESFNSDLDTRPEARANRAKSRLEACLRLRLSERLQAE